MMIINLDKKRGEIYSLSFPKGSSLIGIVEREDGRVGALIQLKNGYYAVINHGELGALNQHMVKKRLNILCKK